MLKGNASDFRRVMQCAEVTSDWKAAIKITTVKTGDSIKFFDNIENISNLGMSVTRNYKISAF